MYNTTKFNVQFMYNLENSRLTDSPSQTREGAPKGRGRVDGAAGVSVAMGAAGMFFTKYLT